MFLGAILEIGSMVKYKGVAEDLNSIIGTGLYAYDISTANRPVDYGVLFQFGNTAYAHVGASLWVFQFALSTSDNSIRLRRSINGAAWTNWDLIM